MLIIYKFDECLKIYENKNLGRIKNYDEKYYNEYIKNFYLHILFL